MFFLHFSLFIKSKNPFRFVWLRSSSPWFDPSFRISIDFVNFNVWSVAHDGTIFILDILIKLIIRYLDDKMAYIRDVKSLTGKNYLVIEVCFELSFLSISIFYVFLLHDGGWYSKLEWLEAISSKESSNVESFVGRKYYESFANPWWTVTTAFTFISRLIGKVKGWIKRETLLKQIYPHVIYRDDDFLLLFYSQWMQVFANFFLYLLKKHFVRQRNSSKFRNVKV